MLKRSTGHHKRHIAAAVVCGLLGGCADLPQDADQQAQASGFERDVVMGAAYSHVVYSRPPRGPAPAGDLHVYIENDGVPWLGRFTAATDPTPGRPLMLGLMALDPAAVLYVGRPCYFGLARRPPCTSLAWTHERYSPAVVDSLAAVVERRLSAMPGARLSLFGHSGGGTLAVLLAERLSQTVAVVTLAGNLDVRAWTEWHGFTPLQGSLDPASRPALAPRVLQRHYVGSADRTIPPELSRRYARGRPGVELIEVAGFDHACCWHELWPQVLRGLPRAP